MKLSFFAFLVCAFNKEPIELSDFDLLYLKNYFELSKAVKTTVSLVKDLQNKVNFTKKCSTPPIALSHVLQTLFKVNYLFLQTWLADWLIENNPNKPQVKDPIIINLE